MKPRVMLLIYHLSNGGAERAVSLWSKMLADAGYNVTVMTCYPSDNEYHLDSRVTRANLHPDKQTFLQYPDKIAVCKKLLEQYLNQHPQDVLIPFIFGCNLLAALCNQKNLKVISQTIRDTPWTNESGLKLTLRNWAIQKQGSVILQNDEQAEYFNQPLFQHVKKYIVHNALNPDILNLKKETYRPIKKIIAVGRLVPQKNHKLMIETIRILRDEYHENYYLDIYGEGDLQGELQAQIDQSHLNDQVKLCGRSNNIFPVLINYDLFFMTSIHEGMPNALLEAMGLGVPCLAVKCRTGITELIDNEKSGYIVDSYDPHTLAKKIHEINHQQQLEQIGKQARADMIARYTPDKIQTELIHVIDDLVQNPIKPQQAILQSAPLQTDSDYQNYFDYSLYILRNVNQKIGKQVFNHVREVVKDKTLNLPGHTEEVYYDCLCQNQFERFMQHLKTENDFN